MAPYCMAKPILRVVYSLASVTHTMRLLVLWGDDLQWANRRGGSPPCEVDVHHWVLRPPGREWIRTLRRVAFVHVYHDLRRAHRRPRWRVLMDLGAAVAVAAPVLGATAAMAAVLTTAATPARTLLLAVTGMAHQTAVLYIVDVFYRLWLLPFGWDAPPCMHHPWAAVSVGSLWRHHWNWPIQAMLQQVVWAPVGTRVGQAAALGVTFVASGALHVYPMGLVGCSVVDCGQVLAFFIVQPVLICAERWLRVRGSAWTLCAMVLSSALLVAPLSHLADIVH
eukprot:NODE_1336_length_1001_cov_101.114496_g1029_i0.p1 GENE.NODE_1336_length_1001_cov_101.114496_g1029_i0~~NODE_1336_length_1001_cov_101.114496_g1029_i0.p1  ORF type:complete len:280 (-),score=50.68 NODE_1336_length_1001_cov_101.114496_g1029_i0:126-965(-)